MQQKRLIILKSTPYSEVGHLYEHLYLTALRRYFAARSLYAHLDYQIQAFTSSKGIIYFTVYLYTADAIACLGEVSGLVIDTDLVDMHIRQLALEGGNALDVVNASSLSAELDRLDREEWRDIQSLDFINMQDVSSVSDLLRVSEEPCRRLKMYIDITFDGSIPLAKSPELLALFHQFSSLLLYNYVATLSSQTDAYSAGNDFYDYGDAASMKNVFYIDVERGEFQAAIELVRQVTGELMSPAALKRFEVQMQENFQGQGNLSDPDDMQLYQETGLLVGAKGWQMLATDKNIADIIACTSVEIKIGRKRVTLPLLR